MSDTMNADQAPASVRDAEAEKRERERAPYAEGDRPKRAEGETDEAYAARAEEYRPQGRGDRTKPVYLVDIKELAGVPGALLVEATSPRGVIESATFSGPRASERAMKYIEAIEGFERRAPTEYPKYVRRGGVEHLLLDAEHEKQIGAPTDADKSADDAKAEARDDAHQRHAMSDEARARVAAMPSPMAPRPERLAEGESDEAYAGRLAHWQAERRGGVSIATPVQEPGEADATFAARREAWWKARRDFKDAELARSFPQGFQASPSKGQPWLAEGNSDFAHSASPSPAQASPQVQQAASNGFAAQTGDSRASVASSVASSVEAQRLRDIAARRRAPDIENMSED